jgi:hypothetical protein
MLLFSEKYLRMIQGYTLPQIPLTNFLSIPFLSNNLLKTQRVDVVNPEVVIAPLNKQTKEREI